jgi:signal peptidase I
MSTAVPARGRTDERPSPGESREALRAVAGALLLALALRVIGYQPFTIPSASMGPTLVTGDYILVSKFPYGWSRASLPFNPPVGEGRLFGRDPRRGDIVVFRDFDEPAKTVIKRVIGLPGDRVQVRGGAVSINDRALARRPLGAAGDRDAGGLAVLELEERTGNGRDYRTYDRGPRHEGDDTGIVVVPAGHYFVLGDNRDNSLDSRFSHEVGGVGLVPAETLVGRAEVVLFSWRPGASLYKPWTWLALTPGRFLRPLG